MTRNLIFVCYAREGAGPAARRDLSSQLQPLARTLGLQVWVDEQGILSGDEWDRKIRAAIDRSAGAVLLVTPELLSSEYVEKTELPLLMSAHRDKQLKLHWLSVAPCSVEKQTFRGTDRNGAQFEFKLTDYQGLNGPDDGLPLVDPERARMLKSFAQRVCKPFETLRAEPAAFEVRPTLVVELERNGDAVHCSYRDKYGTRLGEASSASNQQTSHAPDALFRALFPRDEDWEEALARLHPGVDTHTLQPDALPLRVRIVSRDDELLCRPWRTATWDARPLTRWHFECALSSVGTGMLFTLPTPLMLAAFCVDGRLGATQHINGLRAHIEGSAKDLAVETATNAQEFRAVVGAGKPLYEWAHVFAEARLEGGQLELQVPLAGGGSSWIAFDELLATPPTLLDLLLVSESPNLDFIPRRHLEAAGTMMRVRHVPRGGRDFASRLAAARSTVAPWFDRMLAHSEGPVVPWRLWPDEPGVEQRHWTSCNALSVQREPLPSKPVQARIKLDRLAQRESLRRIADSFFEAAHRSLRSVAVVACAERGNHVELLGKQGEYFIRERTASPIPLRYQAVRNAMPHDANVASIREALIGAVCQNDMTDLRAGLLAAAPQGERLRVVLLDWGHIVAHHEVATTLRCVDAWLDLHAEFGRKLRADSVRVLSVLGVEFVGRTDAGFVRELEERMTSRFLPESQFELLEHLDRVKRHHVVQCLQQLGAGANTQAIGELLMKLYDGHFEQTAGRLEEGQDYGWTKLLEKLRREWEERNKS